MESYRSFNVGPKLQISDIKQMMSDLNFGKPLIQHTLGNTTNGNRMVIRFPLFLFPKVVQRHWLSEKNNKLLLAYSASSFMPKIIIG